jgi:branched-chain amino acid transport system ATP-binding protein
MATVPGQQPAAGAPTPAAEPFAGTAGRNAAGAGQEALRLRGVGRSFGGLHAVREVDLDVPDGQRRVVIGPNGAGKTTLFNLVAGELAVSAGSIHMFGTDTTPLPARQRARLGLARTYQRSRTLAGLTVTQNLYLAHLGVRRGHLRLLRRPADERLEERAGELAAMVGLGARRDVRAAALSHGEQRQLEIGMGLAAEPRLLLLDEPASGLSRGERVALIDLLLGLDAGLTILLIEHDMDVALRIGERVTMMHEGRVVVEGTPDEIRADDTVQRLYLGGDRPPVDRPPSAMDPRSRRPVDPRLMGGKRTVDTGGSGRAEEAGGHG